MYLYTYFGNWSLTHNATTPKFEVLDIPCPIKMTHCDGRACAMGQPMVYCVGEELKSFPWTTRPDWDSNWQNSQHYLLPIVPSTCATEDWGPGQIGLAFDIIKLSCLMLLFVLVLFGWPMFICHKPTTIWFGRHICNAMNLQLGNCPSNSNSSSFLNLGQSPTTNNTQTKYMQRATRFWVQIHLQPTSFIWIINFRDNLMVPRWA